MDRGQRFVAKLPLAVIIGHPHQLEHIGGITPALKLKTTA